MTRRQRRTRSKRTQQANGRTRKSIAAGAGLSLGAALGLTASAQAADFTVTNLSDAAPGSLRDAVDLANATPTSDRVLFQSGLTGTIGLTSGEIYVDYPLQVVGPGAGTLSVSGGDTQRIFTAAPVAPGPMSLAVSGLTLTQGLATGGGPAGTGGAIQGYQTDVSVIDSVVTANNADDGGGLGVQDGSLTVRGSTISANNTTSLGSGGGIFALGANSFVIDSSTVSGNTAEGFGGGILVPYSGAVTITDSTISGNQTTGPGSTGGGLASFGAGNAAIRGSTISGNSSDDTAGGIYSLGEPLRIERSTVSGNTTVYDGGGVAAFFGIVTVVDSTIAANRTTDPTGYGGGIWLCNCASAALQNTIAADNTASQGADVYLSTGAPLDAAFSLIEAPIGAGTLNETVPGSNVIGKDPQLSPLAANGGPTQTQALAKGSPAVDAGDDFGQTTDQRGQQRPSDFPDVANSAATGADGSDIGAFELGAPPGPAGTCADRDAAIFAVDGVAKGTPDADVIFGSNKKDVIRGRGGNDLICGRGGNDKLYGGKGNDRLFGGKGNDSLFGGPGEDGLRGGKGKDFRRQ